MFNKRSSPPPAPTPPERPHPLAQTADAAHTPRPQKLASLIANDMTLEGNITGGGGLQVDGAFKGDVRVKRVTIGDGGHVAGDVFAEAVEVRGRVSGSITAKQVRLYGACHVVGDITHEQLAMETGAFFQGRSLPLQRPPAPAPQPTVILPRTPSEPTPASASPAAPKDNINGLKPSPAS